MASLILSVALTEVALRVAGLGWPLTWQNHPDRGLSRPPGITWLQEGEGRALVQINSMGFRSREPSPDKPRETLRVAVLGDSYTEALQVPVEQRFTEVAESELARLLNRPVEVLNFGMEGNNTAQEFITFMEEVRPFRPDVVVLQFFAANDVRGNARALAGDPARPYFVLDEDGSLVLDASFREHNGAWFRRNGMRLVRASNLAQMAYEGLQRARRFRAAGQAAHAEPDRPRKPVIPENLGLDAEVFHEPRDTAWIDAWRATDAVIGQMHAEVEASGAAFLVVAVPHAARIHPSAAVRKEFGDAIDVADLSYADQRIENLGARLGFPTVILSRPLGEHALRTGEYLCGFANTRLGWGHFNAAGHRLTGQIVAESIAEAIAQRPR